MKSTCKLPSLLIQIKAILDHLSKGHLESSKKSFGIKNKPCMSRAIAMSKSFDEKISIMPFNFSSGPLSTQTTCKYHLSKPPLNIRAWSRVSMIRVIPSASCDSG